VPIERGARKKKEEISKKRKKGKSSRPHNIVSGTEPEGQQVFSGQNKTASFQLLRQRNTRQGDKNRNDISGAAKPGGAEGRR